MHPEINTLALAHQFVRAHVKPGDLCIDATCGKGRDTLFLCELTGETGSVLAFDIQEAAVNATSGLLAESGWHNARVLLASHETMGEYAAPESVAAIMFNFGWLPGGDHNIFTRADSSLAAIASGLELLAPGGVMSLSIYYGRNNGYEERDRILEYLKTVDQERFTVITAEFANRKGEPPVSAFIIKD